jgi:hypothetical protein
MKRRRIIDASGVRWARRSQIERLARWRPSVWGLLAGADLAFALTVLLTIKTVPDLTGIADGFLLASCAMAILGAVAAATAAVAREAAFEDAPHFPQVRDSRLPVRATYLFIVSTVSSMILLGVAPTSPQGNVTRQSPTIAPSPKGSDLHSSAEATVWSPVAEPRSYRQQWCSGFTSKHLAIFVVSRSHDRDTRETMFLGAVSSDNLMHHCEGICNVS